MHPSLLLSLGSFTFEVYDSFQSFIREVVLQHLLLIHFVYFRLLVSAAVAASGKLAVAVRGPVSLVSDFIIRVPICVPVVLPRAAVVEVRVVHRSDVSRDFLQS